MTLTRTLLLVAASCLLFALAIPAHAQQFDIAFGYGTVLANPASDATITQIANGTHAAQSLSGGGYPSFSGDLLFWKHFGVGAEVAWRAHQNVNQFFQPYRPIFYDVNAVWAPPLGKRAQAELQGGIGALSIRFYNPVFTCNFFGCTNYSSSNHFTTHVGGGIRLYVWRNVFLRPEANFYFINNNFEFAGPRAIRVGASIGYSLRNQM
jgi:hypothetical protein